MAAGSTGFDPTRVAHLGGRFAPVTREVDEAELRVEGELPAELDGVYLRNGPNPRFSPIGSYLFPIDGDGMVHGVWMSEGRARYRNRFVRTPAMRAEERAGRALWGGVESLITPGLDEVGPDLAHTLKDLPDINVVRHGGRLLALAESDSPFRLSPDLETLGKETFGGRLPAGITAHPKIDPRTGEMAVFCYGLEAPYLTWALLGPDGEVVRGPTPVAGAEVPVMIHDMALTARYLVIVLAPAYLDLAAAMRGGSFLDWRPEDGTRIALVPRDGGTVRWAHDSAFWVWHTVNAHDLPTGEVVLDYVQWPGPGLGPRPAGPGGAPRGLARAVLDPAAGTVRRELLDDARVEFPRVDDRMLAGPHRRIATAAGTGRTPDLLPGEFDGLRWYEVRDGEVSAQTWDANPLSVGEPVFAPVPGTTGADEGYWLTFATDRTDLSSQLLVLPGGDPAAGPVARVHIPVRVPLGLHGIWLPARE
ncbi:carotenoid oxygenase family protein [Actinomadura sp. WMMB 499]|uniref:carotenoid oxygenase family protein n=1 Tax=Actinomadura sp. WMMB 499 TaxID=1219491 RepID=UPI0012464185|nr:carotenoid oxygenase family protein [Actinomadura sp. WMMB 499]QFG24146.1 carotenoid oxygenase family protein [Actinomadura sp. WMMB 499]